MTVSSARDFFLHLPLEGGVASARFRTMPGARPFGRIDPHPILSPFRGGGSEVPSLGASPCLTSPNSNARNRSSMRRCGRRRRMRGRCSRCGSALTLSSSMRTTRRPAPSRCAAGLFTSIGSSASGRETAGIISATTGNHGQSLAFAAGRSKLPVTIYVPHGNSVEKNRAMRAFGAHLIEHGEDFEAARDEAMTPCPT